MSEHFVKQRSGAPEGLFKAEAAGLDWLRVDGGAPVVKVTDWTGTSITLERLTPVPATKTAAEAFGAQLAVTHNAGASAFGVAPTGYDGPSFIADLPMTTSPEVAWGVFFGQQRVWPYATQAVAALGTGGLRVMEALVGRLVAGVFDDDAPPARLHGDLWAGNVVFTEAGGVLIDPSAHGGHRVSDLAMLALFGAPHLERVFAAYEAASSHLPDGWRGLIGLHQVYPLLVHTVLFGGGYAGQAVQAARAYL
ncbi:MAG: fructosamine kinase family protein [Propionibacteriaceae bacterium]|nr:fructosamine kinase family protein [Propionibacteriaceae bacterium]